ncbi:galactokinase [Rhodohalobacter sp. 614A]|uniref:galactokinase n=1 Tax=Rhodohalobacter sp. 614A TaxID=2908649 RepID=UPI001F335ECD|nr:galactokinase [Rhodohalobacter sp. 614A]
MNQLAKRVKREFQNRFDDDYILINSPGRVNLIGEHTDYNDGFVLPAAVNKQIYLAISDNHSDKAKLFSVDLDDYWEADITKPLVKSEKGWPNYLLGVVDQLQHHGYEVSGFDCAFGGDIPIGAGMSSSAALEGAVLYGLTELFELDISPEDMAKIAQKAENEFVGVQCGIMDQFVSLNGKEDHAMKLDCRSLEYEFYPFKFDDIHIVLCDTQVQRELVSSEYNIRRSQCEEGVKVLQQFDSSIQNLRDVSLSFLQSHQKELDPVVYKRCKYVIEENQRVLDACKDLNNEDLVSFGQRMYASHMGLKDEYEVSCKELDILVEEARSIEGVYGSRMMGGGFGGCTINLVEDSHLASFKKQIAERYHERTGKETKIYQAKVSGGTHLVDQSARSVKEI